MSAQNELQGALAGMLEAPEIAGLGHAFLFGLEADVLYGGLLGEHALDELARFFAEYHAVPLEEVRQHLYVHQGAEAARHLDWLRRPENAVLFKHPFRDRFL